ncbi:MAG: hypothetical protein Q7S76_01310 [bacterium]|nr:hypothetical protein [bacterium]
MRKEKSADLPKDEADEESAASEVKASRTIITAVYVILVVFGIVTGYLLSQSKISSGSVSGKKPTRIETDTVVGISDTATFKDSAEGIIEKGGLEQEGSHKLLREGGPSQTAYLISSVVDLDLYVGKKVKVWGQTIAAKQAAWLMDVGKIELE